MSKRVLIVGGVAGGASTAARLRRLDEDTEIILFERGPYISYANCGLPYHVGGVIPNRKALLLLTPEVMRGRFNVDVRVMHEVTSIDRAGKTVTVRDIEKGADYTERYDTLVLATGSQPVIPPVLGCDSPRVMTMWTVTDTDRINAFIKEQDVKSAAVVGGGFIGLEIAENLHHLGLGVTIVEMLNQVLAPLDNEMARILHGHIAGQGVGLMLGKGVEALEEAEGKVTLRLQGGGALTADMVIMCVGVRPNSALAKNAGLAINQRGGIVTDAFMRTSDPAIYAVGDAVEVEDFVTGGRTMIPLAGPANKQGRIAAGNILGGSEAYKGTQGAAIVKVFDLDAATLGHNEKMLARQGLVRGQDYETITIAQDNHARYYPGAKMVVLKMLFSLSDRRILGAQIVGREGVDKRIDTLSVAMRLGAKATDLGSLEMAYAPPYSSAKDPVNMLGFAAENLLAGRLTLADWDAPDHAGPDTLLLDVREVAECNVYMLPGALNIPLGELRGRLDEVPRGKEIIVFCRIGVRAHTASMMLQHHGYDNVKVYPGGMQFYLATHQEVST
jgi:NADPH-dependent 2,4-dienoyl-CoA reductase/sulfur reductase-like enzyme/rhodanese-related sulfurtransferase